MTLKNELPKTGDIKKCCGRDTFISKMRVDTRMMSDPPETVHRWVHIAHWQCVAREEHHGEVWTTSDDKNIKHINVFGDEE